MAVTTPQLTIAVPHNNDTINLNQSFPVGGQVTNQFVSGEPVLINTVTVRVDNEPAAETQLTPVKDNTQTKVTFSASARVTGCQDPHTVTVTATNNQKASATKTVSVLTAPVVVVPPVYTVQHIPSGVANGYTPIVAT